MAPVPSELEVNASPARYLLKFESFSVLSANGIDKYESSVFDSSGYKWKLIIYPDGDGSEGGLLHLFSTAEKHSGHNAFMQLREFKNPSKGCLVEDCCILEANVSVIGAVNDVSVIKNQREGDCVPLLDPIMSYKHKWKISKFSHLKDKVYSDEFPVGDYKWKLLLFPAGNGGEKDRSISIYLVSVDAEKFDSGKRVHAKSRISVINQHTGAHYERSISHWFSAAENDWGFTNFMPLHEFKNPRKGYLVEDYCIVEADINLA